MNKNYKEWSIERGDYQKDVDNPQKYYANYRTKKKIGKLIKVIVGIGVTLLIFGVILAAVIN